jgi:hypothetical protein
MGLENPKLSMLLVLITSITAFTFGILLFISEASIYGSVVHSETSEWDQGAILDVIASD